MSFITDLEFDSLLQGQSPPIRGTGSFALSTSGTVANPSQVQPCSIDLRVDEVILPGDTDSDGVRRTDIYTLSVGESVRVSTIEEFALPADIGGLLFAPSRLTRQGILVPDIGHIDPGFDGKLRLTLINVGRLPQQFRRGDTIATVLLFRLASPVGKQFEQFPGSAEHYNAALQDINHLSRDFLMVEDRARSIAEKAARKAVGNSGWTYAFVQIFLPILLGIVASSVLFLLTWNSRLVAAEARLGDMQHTQELQSRIKSLEERIEALSDRKSK